MQALDLPFHLASYDISDFPLVKLDWSKLSATKLDIWTDDTITLIDSAEPFVLLIERLPSDRKARMNGPLRWFKPYIDALASHCRAVIIIEPDPSQRTTMRLDTTTLEKAFGTDVLMSPSTDQAALLSTRLLESPPIPRDQR